MRTARTLTVSHRMLAGGRGVCSRGVVCSGGGLLRGVHSGGGICSGVCLLLGGGWGTPPVNRITDACKNINLAPTSLRAVNYISKVTLNWVSKCLRISKFCSEMILQQSIRSGAEFKISRMYQCYTIFLDLLCVPYIYRSKAAVRRYRRLITQDDTRHNIYSHRDKHLLEPCNVIHDTLVYCKAISYGALSNINQRLLYSRIIKVNVRWNFFLHICRERGLHWKTGVSYGVRVIWVWTDPKPKAPNCVVCVHGALFLSI